VPRKLGIPSVLVYTATVRVQGISCLWPDVALDLVAARVNDDRRAVEAFDNGRDAVTTSQPRTTPRPAWPAEFNRARVFGFRLGTGYVMVISLPSDISLALERLRSLVGGDCYYN
jgi:hypothetical protein